MQMLPKKRYLGASRISSILKSMKVLNLFVICIWKDASSARTSGVVMPKRRQKTTMVAFTWKRKSSRPIAWIFVSTETKC